MLRIYEKHTITTEDLLAKIKDYFLYYYKYTLSNNEKTKIDVAALKAYLRIIHSKLISNDLVLELIFEHLKGNIEQEKREQINQNLTLISNNCVEVTSSNQKAINIKFILNKFVKFFKMGWNGFYLIKNKQKFIDFTKKFKISCEEFFIDQDDFKLNLSEKSRNILRNLINALDLKNSSKLNHRKSLINIDDSENSNIFQFSLN